MIGYQNGIPVALCAEQLEELRGRTVPEEEPETTIEDLEAALELLTELVLEGQS